MIKKVIFWLFMVFNLWGSYDSELTEIYNVDFSKTTWKSYFDFPEYYNPIWNKDTRLVYCDYGYFNFIQHEDYLIMPCSYGTVENKGLTTRLVTEHTFTFRIPFEVEVVAKFDRKSGMHPCPAWVIYDKDKKFAEIDIVEFNNKTQKAIFSFHKGEDGYHTPTHEIYNSRLYFPEAVSKFNTYRVNVTANKIEWYINNFKTYELDIEVPDYDYHLRITNFAYTYNKVKGLDSLPGNLYLKQLIIRK